MAHVRKTRQQKIQHSLRKPRVAAQASTVEESSANLDAKVNKNSHEQEIAETQVYVMAELKRIGWISLLCAAILLVATIFLSEFSWAEAVRGWLSF